MQLFNARVRRQWQSNLSLFRSLADWTTYLYLLIPASLFLFFLLRETVFQSEYGIVAAIRPEIIVLAVLCWSSTLIIRNFCEPADRLFLIQQMRENAQLKRAAYYYSFLCNLFYIGIGYFLLFPLFRNVHMFSDLKLIQLAVALIACYVVSNSMLVFLHSKWTKFVGVTLFIMLCVFAIFSATVWSIAFSGVAVFFGLIVYEMRAIRTYRYFENQILTDAKAYYRWQSRIVMMNPEFKALNLPKYNVKAPWLFKRARATTEVGALVEMSLKTMLRNRNYLWNYARIIVIAFPLMFILPWWGICLLVIFLYYGLKGYLSAILVEIQEHEIFKILHCTQQHWADASKKLTTYLVNYVVIFYIAIAFIRMFVL